MPRSSIPLFPLFGFAHTVFSLALPQPSATQPPSVSSVVGADTNFVTMYGFFDSPPLDGSADHSSAHLPEVFKAMAHQTGVNLAQTAPVPTSTSPIYPMGSPPMLGPGLVVLSTPVLQQIDIVTSLPAATVRASPIPTRTPATSNRNIVLGSVIGSILLLTLGLFFLLDPTIGGKILRFCRSRGKSRPRTVKQAKETTPPADDESWICVSYLPNQNDQTLVDPEKFDMKTEKEGESLPSLPQAASQLAPPTSPSKVSFYDSEYQAPPAPRDSAIPTSSELNAVSKPAVTFVPGQKPVRPPRPPTSDSPALSESVYFACSDKPYVVTESDTFPPKRNLTPSEFFALHVPGVLANFSSSNKKTDRSSTAENLKRASGASKRKGSRHCRTKSAPLSGISLLLRKRSNVGPVEEDEDEDPDLQAPMIQRLMQHRRSRSASGWAYPDRPKSRRQLNS